MPEDLLLVTLAVKDDVRDDEMGEIVPDALREDEAPLPVAVLLLEGRD